MPNPIYDLMYGGESGAAGYNAYNRGTYTDAEGRERIRPGNPPMDFSRFTLGEVMDMQALERRDPERVFAVGKYQIIPDTMTGAVTSLGLDRNQPFSADLQDRLFSEYLLRDKQPSVRDYIEGREGATLRAAQHGLSREWASFGDPENGGRSHYGGANRAHITLDQSEAALTQMRRDYQAAIDRGLPRDDAWRAATAIDPAQRETRQPAQGAPAMADGMLRRNESGPDVVGLQRSLNQLGIRDADGNALRDDGDFGRRTEEAVRAFQRANGLREDGIAGPRTLNAIGEKLPPGTVTVERAEVTGLADGRRTEGANRVEPATRTPLVTDAAHPGNALFVAIQRQLPEGTRPEVAANVTLQAMENGITSPDRLRGVAVVGSNVHLQGPFEGARVSVDLNAPTADLRAMSEHMARQADEQTREQSRTREQDQRQTPLPPTISV